MNTYSKVLAAVALVFALPALLAIVNAMVYVLFSVVFFHWNDTKSILTVILSLISLFFVGLSAALNLHPPRRSRHRRLPR